MDPSGSSTEPPKQAYPFPETEISEILGLLELLKIKGGRADIYRLAGELQMEYGDTLNVIRDAELLKLVNTPGGDVVLEDLGRRLSESKVNQRKLMIRTQIEKIPVFKRISDFLKEQSDHEASRSDVLEKLAELLPNENAEESFSAIVTWGRYAELFGYNDDSETFYLDDEE